MRQSSLLKNGSLIVRCAVALIVSTTNPCANAQEPVHAGNSGWIIWRNQVHMFRGTLTSNVERGFVPSAPSDLGMTYEVVDPQSGNILARVSGRAVIYAQTGRGAIMIPPWAEEGYSPLIQASTSTANLYLELQPDRTIRVHKSCWFHPKTKADLGCAPAGGVITGQFVERVLLAAHASAPMQNATAQERSNTLDRIQRQQHESNMNLIRNLRPSCPPGKYCP